MRREHLAWMVTIVMLAGWVTAESLPAGAHIESPVLTSSPVAPDFGLRFSTRVASRPSSVARARNVAQAISAPSEGNAIEPNMAFFQGSVVASVVSTVDLSVLQPPVPDPTGVVYDVATGRLLVTDSEVEETGLFSGFNVFNLSREGDLLGGGSTLPFSAEPTGASFNSSNGNLFLSDDVSKEVFEVDPGPDGSLFTADDVVTSFDTLGLGSSDPEGVEFDPVTGHLYILDGLARKVFRVDPGLNGVFDGAAIDDVVTVIDLGLMGAEDPEGIAIDVGRRVLLIADHPTKTIYEITRAGNLFRTVDISLVGSRKVAGLTVAPATSGPGDQSVFLVDRGIDNGTDPDENDGALIEVSIPPPSSLPGGTFIDDDGNTHEANIEAIAAAGLTAGCNPPLNDEYCPSGTVTRAEMAVFLVQAMNEAGNLPTYQGYFMDVAQGAWFTPWVERLFELGVSIGFPDGTYRPGAFVTRAEMSVFLINAFDHTGELADPVGVFDDVDIGEFYADDAELLGRLGITSGCQTNPLRYCPDDPVRRDHMATFLALSLNLEPIAPPPG